MIAGRKVRGKSMLAQTAMSVVIALAEQITLGMRERITADTKPKEKSMVEVLKVPQ